MQMFEHWCKTAQSPKFDSLEPVDTFESITDFAKF